MHRVRQSLPYFKGLGWEAEVIAVYPEFVETNNLDELLLQTIPADIKVHLVKAWQVKATRKFGLGSLSMRSFYFFKKKGNELLRKKKYDLIFFSTTAFHVMALGPYWKRKFKVPYVVDIQDPWRNDFYLDKPKFQRPPKFEISYRIDKYLESKTIPKADGIISVSKGYIETFQNRYKNMAAAKTKVIPFGGSSWDFEVASHQNISLSDVHLSAEHINLVYVGRGGYDLQFAFKILLKAFKNGLDAGTKNFDRFRFWFVGTDYAPKGQGTQTFLPIAREMGLQEYVLEITDRISYFETLNLLREANILCILGSTDTSYTASKLYSYILARKPVLAIFHQESSVTEILSKTKAGKLVSFLSGDSIEQHTEACLQYLIGLIEKNWSLDTDWNVFNAYSAEELTKEQVQFFEAVLSK